MQFKTIVLFIDMPKHKFLTINIKMDIMHSHIWTLLCSKDDASWTIKDATLAIQYLMPNGRMYRCVDVPGNVAALVRKAAEQLHINTEVYARSFSENQKDPFWEKIENRIHFLEKNITTHHDLLLCLLALLYVDLPPRRNKEFQTMIIDPRGTEKEYSMDNTFDGQMFCFRSFKSVMRDKHQCFSIDKLTSRLRDALELWLKNHPCLPFDSENEYADFLCDEEGCGYKKINSFTRLLQKALGTSSQELRRKWFSKFT